jgi:hypothetical protein
MKIQIKIKHPDHGVIVVTTLPADLMKWERMTKSKMTDLVENRRVDGEDVVKVNMGFEDLMVMAFAVLQRGNQTDKKFDLWANELESVELIGIDETDFTQTAPSDEPSPILPSKE